MNPILKLGIAFVLLLALTLGLTTKQSVQNAYELEELVANERDFFLVIGSEECSYCQEYKRETLNHYKESEMGVPLVQIDWFDLTSEEQENLTTAYGIELNVTPTTYYFEKGKIGEKREGVLTLDNLKEMKK